MTDEQSIARMNNQADDEQRRAVADHIIINDGTADQLAACVGEFWSDS
jgi:dephospho-CoA kinase